MNDVTNAEKLHIEPGQIVWVTATNDEQGSLLDPLPEGAEMVDEATDGMDAAVLFVEDQDTLVVYLDEILPQLGSTPVVWIAYPRGSRSEISQPGIESVVSDYSWNVAGEVSLDETWAAARLIQS